MHEYGKQVPELEELAATPTLETMSTPEVITSAPEEMQPEERRPTPMVEPSETTETRPSPIRPESPARPEETRPRALKRTRLGVS